MGSRWLVHRTTRERGWDDVVESNLKRDKLKSQYAIINMRQRHCTYKVVSARARRRKGSSRAERDGGRDGETVQVEKREEKAKEKFRSVSK